VAQSLASSRGHLGVEIIDSYVLHGPMQREGLTADDWSAWRAMEAAHDAGEVRQLGVSNVSPGQLELLCAQARIAPSFVQNRCFAVQAWDLPVRRICQAHDITYQGFSLLTANREVVSHADVAQIAKHYRRTPAQIIFRFALQLGMLPLTGTTDPAHMQADLAVVDFELTETEVKHIERLGVR
jgi:diketogulonate reductase-like aldo/keto reductase